jgi:hypothetical protein
MASWKSAVLFAPVALAGAWAIASSTHEIRELEGEFQRQGEASVSEGASFIETFRAEHADAYLKALDRRREIAARMTKLRRNRFIGLFLVVAAGTAVVGANVLLRISRELEEDRRWLRGEGPPP